MACVGRADDHPALEARVHAEHANEDAGRRQSIQVVWREGGRCEVCWWIDGERCICTQEARWWFRGVVGYSAVSAPRQWFLVGVAEVYYEIC